MTYYRAVQYAIETGNKVNEAKKVEQQIPTWSPNQLRHTRATEVNNAFGYEAAQVTLGHAKADVTQIYAERNIDLAKRVARETG